MRIKLNRNNVIDGAIWPAGTPITPQDILKEGTRFNYHRGDGTILEGLVVTEIKEHSFMAVLEGQNYHSDWVDVDVENVEYF